MNAIIKELRRVAKVLTRDEMVTWINEFDPNQQSSGPRVVQQFREEADQGPDADEANNDDIQEGIPNCVSSDLSPEQEQELSMEYANMEIPINESEHNEYFDVIEEDKYESPKAVIPFRILSRKYKSIRKRILKELEDNAERMQIRIDDTEIKDRFVIVRNCNIFDHESGKMKWSRFGKIEEGEFNRMINNGQILGQEGISTISGAIDLMETDVNHDPIIQLDDFIYQTIVIEVVNGFCEVIDRDDFINSMNSNGIADVIEASQNEEIRYGGYCPSRRRTADDPSINKSSIKAWETDEGRIKGFELKMPWFRRGEHGRLYPTEIKILSPVLVGAGGKQTTVEDCIVTKNARHDEIQPIYNEDHDLKIDHPSLKYYDYKTWEEQRYNYITTRDKILDAKTFAELQSCLEGYIVPAKKWHISKNAMSRKQRQKLLGYTEEVKTGMTFDDETEQFVDVVKKSRVQGIVKERRGQIAEEIIDDLNHLVAIDANMPKEISRLVPDKWAALAVVSKAAELKKESGGDNQIEVYVWRLLQDVIAGRKIYDNVFEQGRELYYQLIKGEKKREACDKSDALALLAFAKHELSYRRKKRLKPETLEMMEELCQQ